MNIRQPTDIQASSGAGGTPIVLEDNRPYVQYVYVEEHYDRPLERKA